MNHWSGHTVGDYYRPRPRRRASNDHYDGRERDDIEGLKICSAPASQMPTLPERDDSSSKKRQRKKSPHRQQEQPRQHTVPVENHPRTDEKQTQTQTQTQTQMQFQLPPRPPSPRVKGDVKSSSKAALKAARKRLRKQEQLVANTENRAPGESQSQPVPATTPALLPPPSPERSNGHKKPSKKSRRSSQQSNNPTFPFNRENLDAMSRHLPIEEDGDGDKPVLPSPELPLGTSNKNKNNAGQGGSQDKRAEDSNIKGARLGSGEPKAAREPNTMKAAGHTSVLDLPPDENTPPDLPGMNLSTLFQKAIVRKQEETKQQRQQGSEPDTDSSSDTEMMDASVSASPEPDHYDPVQSGLPPPAQKPTASHHAPLQKLNEAGFNIRGHSDTRNLKNYTPETGNRGEPTQKTPTAPTGLLQNHDVENEPPPASVDSTSARENTVRSHDNGNIKGAAIGTVADWRLSRVNFQSPFHRSSTECTSAHTEAAYTDELRRSHHQSTSLEPTNASTKSSFIRDREVRDIMEDRGRVSMGEIGFKIRSSAGERRPPSPAGGPSELKIRGMTAENRTNSQHQQQQLQRRGQQSPLRVAGTSQQHASPSTSRPVSERSQQRPTRGAIHDPEMRRPLEESEQSLDSRNEGVKLTQSSNNSRASENDGLRVIMPQTGPTAEAQTFSTKTSDSVQSASSSSVNIFELLRSKAKEIDWGRKNEGAGSLDWETQREAPTLHQVGSDNPNPFVNAKRDHAPDTSSKVVASNDVPVTRANEDTADGAPASNQEAQAPPLEFDNVTETLKPTGDVSLRTQDLVVPNPVQETVGAPFAPSAQAPEEDTASTVHRPQTPSPHARQAEEIQEWLVNTRYYDIPFRRRKQRLLALEKERLDLLKEEEEEQMSTFLSSFSRAPSSHHIMRNPGLPFSSSFMPAVKQESGLGGPQPDFSTSVAADAAATSVLSSISIQHIFPHISAREAEDIQEWLEITRYFDEPYRKRKLRLASLERERQKLLREEEEEEEKQKSASFGFGVPPMFPMISAPPSQIFPPPQPQPQPQLQPQAVNPATPQNVPAPRPHASSLLQQSQYPFQPQVTPQISPAVHVPAAPTPSPAAAPAPAPAPAPVVPPASVEQQNFHTSIQSSESKGQNLAPAAPKDPTPLKNQEPPRSSPLTKSLFTVTPQKGADVVIPEDPTASTTTAATATATATTSTIQSSTPTNPRRGEKAPEQSTTQQAEESQSSTVKSNEKSSLSLKRARSSSADSSRPTKSLRSNNNEASTLQESFASSKAESAPAPPPPPPPQPQPKPAETAVPASEPESPHKRDRTNEPWVQRHGDSFPAPKPVQFQREDSKFSFKLSRRVPAPAPRRPPLPRFSARESSSDDQGNQGSRFHDYPRDKPRPPAYAPWEIPPPPSPENAGFAGFSIRGARYRENTTAPTSRDHIGKSLSPRSLPASSLASSLEALRRNPLDARAHHNHPQSTPLGGRSASIKESMPLSLLPHETSYFILRTQNEDFILAAMEESAWVVSERVSARLGRAFKEYRDVVLFFSVIGSRAFQGYARMETPPGVRYVEFPSWAGTRMADPFRIRWLCTRPVSFKSTMHLTNAFNDNQIIAYAKDGQEVDPEAGRNLVYTMDE